MMNQYQRGNILPYVAALLIVVAFSAQYVYNAYKVSNESTRLQNTVDAAAYSSATVTAQTYNFIALSNRSLIANQIIVAQLATTTSWVRMVRTFVGTINSITQYIPYIGEIIMVVDEIVQMVQEIVEEIMPAFLNVIAQYMSAVSLMQQAAVVPTALIVDDVLNEVVKKNDPDVNVSVATIANVTGETIAQLNAWKQNDCMGEADNASEGDSDNDTRVRCRQFRSIMLASRDGLTQDRVYRMGPEIFMPGALLESKNGIPIGSYISMWRGRGTTMTGPTSTTPFRTWSALDTVSLHARQRWIKVSWSGFKNKSKNFGEAMKLGSGAAIAGDEDCGSDSSCYVVHDKRNYWSKNSKASACADVDQHPIDISNFVLDIISVGELTCEDLTDHYAEDISDGADLGLKKFYDLEDKGLVSDKGHIMVYLRKNRKDLSAYSNTPFGSGGSKDKQLDRFGGGEQGSIHAAASAKVYFRRDNDRWMLPGSKRLDGRIEFGNAYNPFWEVTLDQLSAAEKAEVIGLKSLSSI
jgi:hypothetical protein